MKLGGMHEALRGFEWDDVAGWHCKHCDAVWAVWMNVDPQHDEGCIHFQQPTNTPEPVDITTARKRGTSKQRQVASSPYRSDATPYPDRIIGARELSGYSLANCARLTGIAEADLALFESGLSIPEHDQLLRISEETGFPMAWFYQAPDPAWPRIEHTSMRFH